MADRSMTAQRARARARARRRQQRTHPALTAFYAVVVISVAGGLFYLAWKSQFAAPPSYLFDTPTQPIEAAYCLAVVRALSGGGSGGYIGQAQDFWLKRLLTFSGDVAGNIAKGEDALGHHLIGRPVPDRQWLVDAMDRCSNRAVNYGAHFGAFD
ncbi:hypothetical protein [Thioclava sp. F36-7]|uniref:hypothetical protein n=1 Tax=Thioclava sp. F36-7 TaxID=1915317 RepID=UPI00117EBE6C|nr:hypothetical protein [Thioclava sp. F36-7]